MIKHVYKFNEIYTKQHNKITTEKPHISNPHMNKHFTCKMHFTAIL